MENKIPSGEDFFPIYEQGLEGLLSSKKDRVQTVVNALQILALKDPQFAEELLADTILFVAMPIGKGQRLSDSEMGFVAHAVNALKIEGTDRFWEVAILRPLFLPPGEERVTAIKETFEGTGGIQLKESAKEKLRKVIETMMSTGKGWEVERDPLFPGKNKIEIEAFTAEEQRELMPKRHRIR